MKPRTLLNSSAGWTLIEVMVIISIMSIISGIAIASYNKYTTTANASKLLYHHRVAIRYIITEFRMFQMKILQGKLKETDLRNSLGKYPLENENLIEYVGWEDMLMHWSSSKSPSGANAYLAGLDTGDSGAIGVFSSNTPPDYNYRVVLVRPAFASFDKKRVTYMYLSTGQVIEGNAGEMFDCGPEPCLL